MQKNPRTPRQIVARFLRSDSDIQCETISDLAKILGRVPRRGSVGDMEDLKNRLARALRGKDLFEYEKGGQTHYETKRSRKRRCKIPHGSSKSVYINATEAEPALA